MAEALGPVYMSGAQDPAMPFSSTFEQAPQQALLQLGGVCIMRQGQLIAIDEALLQQQGMKLRPSASCVPDLIITTPALPAPLAIMVANSCTLQETDSINSPAFMDRCSSMANTFRLCCLFLPHTLGAHPAVLQVACDPRFKGKVTLHHYVPQDGLTSSILQLIHSQVGPNANGDQAAVSQERLAAATSPEALHTSLAAISSIHPGLPSAPELQSLLMGVYGSMHSLAGAAVEDVVAYLGCSEAQAQRLWWLFNGTEVQGEV